MKHMMQKLSFIPVFTAFALLSTQAVASTVAIVNKENPTTTLTVSELSEIYQLNQKAWKADGSVKLVLPPTGTPAAQALATKVLKKTSESDIGQFYLQAVFTQKIAAAPSKTADAGQAIEKVKSDKGAVTLIDESAATADVKVIKVDGL